MKRAIWMAILLTACSGGDDDDTGGPDATATYCGDQLCNGGENCASCPGDCGACVDTCSSADPTSCYGEDICVGGTCTPAWGRTYRIRVNELVVSTTNPDGGSWDTLGGAPDPFVQITIGGAVALSTSESQDTFTPTFGEFADVVLAAGQTWSVAAWDSDVTDDDNILYCTADPMNATYLRYGGVVCEGDTQTGTEGSRLEIGIVAR